MLLCILVRGFAISASGFSRSASRFGMRGKLCGLGGGEDAREFRGFFGAS
jgi:hypothetical protein